MGINSSKTRESSLANIICCGRKVSKLPLEKEEFRDFDAMVA